MAVCTPSIFATAIFVVAAGCAAPTERLEPAAARAEPRTPGPEAPIDPTPGIRLYLAELTPLNGDLTEVTATGRATFIIDDREGTVEVTVEADDLSPNGLHPQYVHVSPPGEDGSCPTISADANSDDIIDATELAAYAGVALVPLDEENLSSQEGMQSFPASNAFGRLRYRQSARLSAFEGPLWRAEQREPPKLEDAVVVLYGVGPGVELPDSVQSAHGWSQAMSVPVACGEIIRVN